MYRLFMSKFIEKVLFKAKVKREMGSNHEAFLSLTQDESIDVTAVKFSDRTDLMEGVLKDGRRGNFYISAIDIEPYVRFLRNAIELKKEMMEISQDRADIGSKKFLGTVRADLHLVRDYNVQASRYAEEQNISQPELLPLPDLTVPNLGSHGNEHEGENGHGHGILHGRECSHGLNLNDVGSENFGSVHSDDAAHLGTFHDSAHEGTPTDHFQSLGR
uniref:IRS-type PTB domain-containing protein n=1 Tax=Angiostrongylus cantonensis TaxID=6313 RepID=A0A0K0D7B7_ANGCA